jgi:hypothetical protein
MEKLIKEGNNKIKLKWKMEEFEYFSRFIYTGTIKNKTNKEEKINLELIIKIYTLFIELELLDVIDNLLSHEIEVDRTNVIELLKLSSLNNMTILNSICCSFIYKNRLNLNLNDYINDVIVSKEISKLFISSKDPTVIQFTGKHTF